MTGQRLPTLTTTIQTLTTISIRGLRIQSGKS